MQVERVVINGYYSQYPIENNVWLVGNNTEILLIDASHQADEILKAIGRRRVIGIILTHGHQDHINVALELADLAKKPPIYLNPGDLFLWKEEYPDNKATTPNQLVNGSTFRVGDISLQAIHTPGHTPGSTCLYWAAGNKLFTGDTLFPGGPGITRAQYANFDQIINSIKEKLFTLPDETEVLPGHGLSTTIGTEKPYLNEWTKRGW